MALTVSLAASDAWAGPPFLTDDPEPIGQGHWELYVGSQSSVARHNGDASLPFVEVNYGAIPQVQLHIIVPADLSWSDGRITRYGSGDVELGSKIRFVQEGPHCPQVGIYPLLVLPTGSQGLWKGNKQKFLPVWIQKSFGPWTTYGGPALKLAPGNDAFVAGWLVQRRVSDRAILGSEVFVTAPLENAPVQTQVNLGLIFNVSDRHHLLLSAGPSFGTATLIQAYAAYLMTL